MNSDELEKIIDEMSQSIKQLNKRINEKLYDNTIFYSNQIKLELEYIKICNKQLDYDTINILELREQNEREKRKKKENEILYLIKNLGREKTKPKSNKK